MDESLLPSQPSLALRSPTGKGYLAVARDLSAIAPAGVTTEGNEADLVMPYPAGTVTYRPGPMLASADTFLITITGKQTHGAAPWGGIDPIVIGAQVVMGLQTIVSRNVNITEAPAIVTIGRFTGGNRSNIVPDTVELEGTVRAYGVAVRENGPLLDGRCHSRLI